MRGIIGVIHMPAMPGDPAFAGTNGFAGVQRFALHDAEALVEGGVDALIIENFGSAPFVKGTEGERLPAHQVAALALVAAECKRRFDVPVGVNCLRNDAMSALGIAAAAGLDFIRVNVHIGAYVTDQGIIEGEAHRTVRYRSSLGGSQIRMLADVLVKHASPLVPIDLESATHDTLARGHADAVIVTGPATGSPISRAVLESVRQAAGKQPVLLGSGVNEDNIGDLLPLADGAIIGTTFKTGGVLSAPVDTARVRRLTELARSLPRWSGGS